MEDFMKVYYISRGLLQASAWLLACLASPACASFYPPDYVIQKSCQTQGPVEVCAINQFYGQYPRLSIVYRGELMAEHWARISAHVTLNDQHGTFSMKNHDYAEYLQLNNPRSYLCWTYDPTHPPEENERPGQYPWCRYTGAPGGGGIVWEVEPAPEGEKELFLNARDPLGQPRAWDVSIRFQAASGEYEPNPTDGSLPRAYSFRFEP
jgi:hypothetical protein